MILGWCLDFVVSIKINLFLLVPSGKKVVPSAAGEKLLLVTKCSCTLV